MDFGPDSQPVQTTHRVITVVADSVEQAEPVVAGIEAAVGPIVTEDQQSKGVVALGYGEKLATGAAAIANAIPGGQGVAVILGGIGTLLGALGTLLGRRKTKALTVAAINAADSVAGGGKALVEAAKSQGVGQIVEAVYQRKA